MISANGVDGVLINDGATLNTVSDNLIGVGADGSTALGNSQDGILVENANNNTIGQTSGVSYYDTNSVSNQPVSAWQGIRGGDTAGQYIIVGTSNLDGLLFRGTIAGVGTSYLVDMPTAYSTSVYGPDNLGGGNLVLVGSYKNADASTAAVKVNGFVFTGTTSDLSNSSAYQTIDYPGAEYNYVHSVMGGLAVGNYDSSIEHGDYGLPLGPGNAYIYNVATGQFITNITYPGSISDTAYGIWYNGGTSYTICGGWSPNAVNNLLNQDQPIGQAYLVDYDSATGQFSNWATFSYPDGTNYITHFEGISSVASGVYTLSADSVQSGSTAAVQGSWVTVTRNSDGSFGAATWVNLNYAGVNPATNISSSNSVYGDVVVGVVIGPDGGFSFQATINPDFQLSNVISANGDNGIEFSSASDNQVAMDMIGVDSTGTYKRGNGQNGILITDNSSNNLIGGEATGGNDPTGGVFVRPPQGNLISGNDGDGVLINAGATGNTLSGNYIGTTASGSAALGNTGDGVAIDEADDNTLSGCLATTNPFVFYNVVSGNGGNGLSVDNSNGTTIQANFFGLGADNLTALGNGLNGVIVEGSSSGTTMGGPIPLGNVDAANGENGIVVQDTASDFTSYNTFCGLAAFETYTNLGNHNDGMLITTTGAGILIRTNVVTENGNDGIEIGGNATGVRVAGNIVGLDTNGNAPMGNKNNGIEVDGNASGDIIGGPQLTFNIIPHNVISSNGGNGVAIDGTAHDIQVDYSYIGTDLTGLDPLGNALAGVLLGPGSHGNTIGSIVSGLTTVISGNSGDGIDLNGTNNNTVIANQIGTNETSLQSLPNGGAGIAITDSSDNIIGGASTGTVGGDGLGQRGYLSSSSNSTSFGPNLSANDIAYNAGNGVAVLSGAGNAILRNSIHNNFAAGIQVASGANLNQPAPVLTWVEQKPFGVQIAGGLSATPFTTYTIEFFANYANEASGNVFLGSLSVWTGSEGTATFVYQGPSALAGAQYYTATATDPTGDTSEFSPVLG